MFYRNFTGPGKKFILSLHYNGDISYLFVNGREELKFKTKKDQLVKENLCLGNFISLLDKRSIHKNFFIRKYL